MQPVNLQVNDATSLLALYGADAVLQVERASALAGAYTLRGTVALVAGTDWYTYADPTGTASDWYRIRTASKDGSLLSEYSTPVQAGAPLAYASVEDLLEMLPRVSGDRDRNPLLDALVRASAVIDARCERDFYRHPAFGTEVRTYDVRGDGRQLVERQGIVSVSGVEVATQTGATYASLASTYWRLRPTVPAPWEPYWQLELIEPTLAPLAYFWPGLDTVRLTGAFGLPAIPPIIRAGCLALAREIVATTLSIGGSPRGDWGNPNALLPAETYVAVQWGKALGPAGAWFA